MPLINEENNPCLDVKLSTGCQFKTGENQQSYFYHSVFEIRMFEL